MQYKCENLGDHIMKSRHYLGIDLIYKKYDSLKACSK